MTRFALLLFLLVAAAFWSLRPREPAPVATFPEAQPAAPKPSAPLSHAPRWHADNLLSSRDLRGFVERHAARSDEPRVAYEISQALEECYAVSKAIPEREDLRPAASQANEGWATYWARHAAVEALAAPCRGFEGHPIEPTRVLALLHRAAIGGEPRARARMLLFRDVAAPKSEVRESITELLATGDPTVIRDVGAFLARGESHVPLGREQVASGIAVLAWELAVCDLGYDCGPASRLTLAQCAIGGNCGAGSYEDALASAEDPLQLAQANRWRAGLVHALRVRDWAWLGLSGSRRP